MTFLDCKHLKCFVEVSKNISENITEKSQLSDLYSIGVELDALIYGHLENANFEEFHGKCSSVLNKLNQHPSLTNSLVILSVLLIVLILYLEYY